MTTRHPIPIKINGTQYDCIISLRDASLIQSSLDCGMTKLSERLESDDLRYEDIAAVIGVTVSGAYPNSGINYASVMQDLFDRGAEDCLLDYIYPALMLAKQFTAPKSFLDNAEALMDVGKLLEKTMEARKKRKPAAVKRKMTTSSKATGQT